MANFNLADYETVDSRIKRFYADHPTGRITTELVESLGDIGKTRWTVKAFVWRDSVVAEGPTYRAAAPDGTGYAFENDGEGMANRTSALENCETSAIGRALANIGYSGDKRASKEEMKKATATPPAEKPVSPPDGWRQRVDGVGSLDDLQALYDTDAHQWFTDEVKLAFKARKVALTPAP